MFCTHRVCITRSRNTACITQTNNLQRTDKLIDDEYYYLIRSIHMENDSITITTYIQDMTLRHYTNKDDNDCRNSGLMKYKMTRA